MEVLTKMDELVNALNKIDLNEMAMPIYKGRVLSENVDAYEKIQKLLNIRPFEPCHQWLYDLDVENLTEAEQSKICNLYKLGCERGFIQDKTDDEVEEIKAIEQPIVAQVEQKPELPTSAFTVLYSAMRDGQIKTGEAFSNAINTRSAKCDVINKLEKAGYQNISILAIEAGDPDMAGCNNTYCKLPELAHEADNREPLSHALDPIGIKASTANSSAQDQVSISLVEKDNEKKEEGTDNEETKDDVSGTKKEKDTSNKKSEDDSAKKDDKNDAEVKDDAADTDTDADKDNNDAASNNKEKDGSTDQEDEEISAADKATLKDSYKKVFKQIMLKCNFVDKSFDDLTLTEKVDFFTELDKAWKNKADPIKFMSNKEIEALEKIVMQK